MSAHIHAEPSLSRQLEIAAEFVHAQHAQSRDAKERPRRSRSSGRRRAAAVAVGLAFAASAGVTCGALTHSSQSGAARTMSIAPGTVSIAPASSSPVRALHPGTPRAFAPTIRELENRGYVQAACTLRGILMVNPSTHRSELVAA
jgi:hypothetical protein